MKIVKKDYEYLKDIDVLIRVYENQSEPHGEKDQICSEILFKEHTGQNHLRFTSWLPRGAVNAIVSNLNKFAKKKWKNAKLGYLVTTTNMDTYGFMYDQS